MIRKQQITIIFPGTDIWMIGGRRKKSNWYWEKSIRIQKEPKNTQRQTNNRKPSLQTIKSVMAYSRFFPGRIILSLVACNQTI